MRSRSTLLSNRSGAAIFCWLMITWGVLFVGASLVSGCTPPLPASENRHVIVIVLDAARADRFDFAGSGRDTSPNLDRLADGGLVFERHFA